eukprot:g3071.t1
MLSCKCTSSPPPSRRRHNLRPEVLHEGFLEKECKGRLAQRVWKRFYAVLMRYPTMRRKKTSSTSKAGPVKGQFRIEFFKHPSSTNSVESVDLLKYVGSNAVYTVDIGEGDEFCFVLKREDEKRGIRLKALSEIARVKWFDAIAEIVGAETSTVDDEASDASSPRSRRSSSCADYVPVGHRERLHFGIFTFRVHMPSVGAIVVVTSKKHEPKSKDNGDEQEEEEEEETIELRAPPAPGSSAGAETGEVVPLDVYLLMKSVTMGDLKEALFAWLQKELRTPQLIVAGHSRRKRTSSSSGPAHSKTPCEKDKSVVETSSGATKTTSNFRTPLLPPTRLPTDSFKHSPLIKSRTIPVAPLPRPSYVVDTKRGISVADGEEKFKTEKRRIEKERRDIASSCLRIWWERPPKLEALRRIRSIVADSSDRHVLLETSTMIGVLEEGVPLKRLWEMRGLVKDLTLVSASYASSRLRCEITGTKTLLDMNSRKYTAYSMICSSGELNWSVRRRYKEFFELHGKVKQWLVMHDRESKLPRLPAKTYSLSGKKMDRTFIARRERALQSYVSGLLSLEWSTECIPILSFFGAMSTSRQEKYERNTERSVVHASEVHKFACPGDVLLFRTKSTLSGIQRMVTVSEWDHVGMITVRDDSKKLWLLEACGDRVVCLPLVPRLKAYAKEYAECIALRRFEKPERTKAMLTKLALFTEEVKGKPYSCTPAKLLRRNSMGDGIESEKQEGYFCSELVAAALKKMGFLGRRMANSYFWPGSYNEGGDIEKHLEDGVVLGSLIVVDCKFVEIGRAVRESSFG